MKFPTLKLNAYFKEYESQKGVFSVWGDFGVGKTTFALQTALNTAKNGKKIIYIYTKPNFPSSKIKTLFIDSINYLDKIVFIKPIDFDDLTSIIFNLEFLILKNENEDEDQYKLIVIDSLTDFYRIEVNKEKKERNYVLNYQLNQIIAILSYISEYYSTDILIVNESTKKRINDHFIEIQSGGKVMEYWILFDIKIKRTHKISNRQIFLTKHPDNKQLEFISILTERGFK
ncbi:hypothetical protein LCGC14_0973440 [marine sediment metagenome]|uniref:Rad51-like C-terminal domain-containing protein n=1 Tax=marine sediment metagenome TaxID=412755 RepID=A0A0F9QU56_9ZZZZ